MEAVVKLYVGPKHAYGPKAKHENAIVSKIRTTATNHNYGSIRNPTGTSCFTAKPRSLSNPEDAQTPTRLFSKPRLCLLKARSSPNPEAQHLVQPLEMYCCRTVLLQEGDGAELSISGHHGTPSTGHEPVGEISLATCATSSNAKNGTATWKAKGSFPTISREIKRLFRKLQPGNADLQLQAFIQLRIREIEVDTDRDFFMNAWEARDYGLVDAVIDDGKPGLVAPIGEAKEPPKTKVWEYWTVRDAKERKILPTETNIGKKQQEGDGSDEKEPETERKEEAAPVGS